MFSFQVVGDGKHLKTWRSDIKILVYMEIPPHKILMNSTDMSAVNNETVFPN
jgi:hypothetical protein